jgi:hypothetical protein
MKITSIFITLVIFGLVDLYVYKGISGMIQGFQSAYRLAISIGYWLISISTLILLIYAVTNRHSFTSANTLTTIIGIFISLLLPKIVFILFLAVEDIYNLAGFAVNRLSSETNYSRRNFISQVGLVASGFMLGSMVYGVLWGKFRFRVVREDINSPNLPQSFDGVRIVQISDTHLGSFGNSFEPVKKAVKIINDLKPDFVFFTGDMVNNNADEAEPWIHLDGRGGSSRCLRSHAGGRGRAEAQPVRRAELRGAAVPQDA